MLSLETEGKIAKLLLCFSEDYQQCQSAKQSLNVNCQFNPIQIFNRLDRLHKGFIDAHDIISFFKDHFVHCSLSEAMRIVMWYDLNVDEKLTFAEFSNVITADEARSLSPVNSNCCCLPYAIELGLFNVFTKELEATRRTSELIMDIKCRFDFSAESLLGAMKGVGYVSKENIRNFLIRTKRAFNERDVECAMMRMDLQRNYRVSLSEMERIFYYPNLDHVKNKSVDNTINALPMKNSSIMSQPLLNQSQSRGLSQTQTQSEDIVKYNSSSKSSMKNSFRKTHSLIQSQPEPQQSNDTLLPSLFNLLLQTEAQIEQMKLELALRSDFNAEDAFSVFESNNSGLIYPFDLRSGLNSFGLSPTLAEVQLLIQKYSLKNSNSLNYADFFDMLVPFDKDARRLIEKRLPSPFMPKCDKTNCFLGATKEIIVKLFEYIIISENKLEVIRRLIQQKFTIDVHSFCEEIDSGKNGFICNEDLWRYLSKQKPSLLPRDSDLLFIRLDRNRDGKVEYDDIKQESIQRIF